MRAPAVFLGILVAAATVTGTTARAQTVAVQSGEHAGFTRLVLDIGADRTWALTGAGDRRTLTLDPPVDGFATARVFDLIPRTRLAAIAPDPEGAGLTLTMACPCEVTGDRYLGRYLVLDISGTAAATAPAERSPEPDALAAIARQTAAERLPDLTTLLAAERAERTLPLRPPTEPELPADPAPPGPGGIDLAEAARIMSEQLARAAASGLLSVAPDRPMSDADPVAAPRPPEPPSATEVRVPEPETGGDQGVPIRAATALDLAQMPRRDPAPPRNDLACAGAILAIRDWSTGLGVSHGLGAMRLALYDDRGRLQRDAALALARHYLFHGFGAEAAHLLGLIDDPPPDLQVIAVLVDGSGGAAFPDEPDPVACSDEELLWRYLDDALAEETLTEATAGRLQRAAAALPQVLRDQIAPRVARSLNEDGFPEAARNLRDMLQRGDRIGAAERLALDLDLGIAPPSAVETARALDLALRDDGADPVRAMAQALAFGRDTGVPVDPARLGAAEALLRENGIGPRTATLWHEVVMARVAAGDIDTALGLLAAGNAIPARERDATLTALFADRALAGDVAGQYLLAQLHGPEWRADGSGAGRARVATIAALEEAGLTDAADVLRARQRSLILPAAPPVAADPGQRLRAAWVLGDWAEVADRAAGPHLAIAQRMVERDGDRPETEGTPDLPALATRLADSRVLREDVLRLLAASGPESRE